MSLCADKKRQGHNAFVDIKADRSHGSSGQVWYAEADLFSKVFSDSEGKWFLTTVVETPERFHRWEVMVSRHETKFIGLAVHPPILSRK